MDLHLIQSGVAYADVAMAAVSWLILLCTYPDFARWRAEGFAEAHEAYTRRVGWVVGPLLLVELAGHVLTWSRSGDLIGVSLVALVWGADGTLVCPLSSSLAGRGAIFASPRKPYPFTRMAGGGLDNLGGLFGTAGRGLTVGVAP
jgi:hypothetical protein